MTSVPDRIDAVVGWRAWTVDGEGRLRSLCMRMQDRWPGGAPLRAVCDPTFVAALTSDRALRVDPYDRPPHSDCSCGIYAVRTAEAAAWESGLDRRTVIGRVALWGRVQEHASGWRAELAYPVELLVHPRLAASVRTSIEERYGVPAQGDATPFFRRAADRLWRRAFRVLGLFFVLTVVLPFLLALAGGRSAGGAFTAPGAAVLLLAQLSLLAWASQRVSGSTERRVVGAAVGTALVALVFLLTSLFG